MKNVSAWEELDCTACLRAALLLWNSRSPPPSAPQHPDFKAEESVYKTRWMPPAKPVGAWAVGGS